MNGLNGILLLSYFISSVSVSAQLSAEKRVVQYHDLPIPISYKGSSSILIVGYDNRPQVADKSQEPEFVGYIRATAGVPWKLKTMSGNSFIIDFGSSIAESLNRNGFSTKSTSIQSDKELNSILSKAQADQIDKILLFKVNDWMTDQYDAGLVAHKRLLKYDVDVTVHNSAGAQIFIKKFIEPGVDLGKKGYGTGDYQSFIPEAVKIELGRILNAEELKAALIQGKIPMNFSNPIKRIALVIGIKSYKFVAPLQNTLNDARDMASALKAKNFEVIEVYDPQNKRQIQDAVLRYFQLLQSNENSSGMVFYSGHGMQVDGANYLIPTDANPQIKADLDDQCLNMDYVMRAIEQAGNHLNIFILDACRNNPFRSFYRSNEQGLSMVATPKGSYIVYATKPGAVASDGAGRNGLFTSKLLKYINAVGLNIEQVFKLTAAEVGSESNDKQRPWIASDYTGNFYFTPGESNPQEVSYSSLNLIQNKTGAAKEETKNMPTSILDDFGHDDPDFKIVLIGSQHWISRNLNVSHFANGDKIQHASTNEDWRRAGNEELPAWCYPGNDSVNGSKYGKLYNWFAVADQRSLCPSGWHVPTDIEWKDLTKYLGLEAGVLLKSAEGFSTFLGGVRGHTGDFRKFGEVSAWWSSTAHSRSNYAWNRMLTGAGVITANTDAKKVGYSVRCLKD